jgi:hypothetical protein
MRRQPLVVGHLQRAVNFREKVMKRDECDIVRCALEESYEMAECKGVCWAAMLESSSVKCGEGGRKGNGDS